MKCTRSAGPATRPPLVPLKLHLGDGLMVGVQVSGGQFCWWEQWLHVRNDGRAAAAAAAQSSAAATLSPSSASARWQLPTCTKTKSQAPV